MLRKRGILQLRRKPPSLPRPKARVPSRRRLKLARRPKRRCRKAPRARNSRRTCWPSSRGSAATSAASTAIGAGRSQLALDKFNRLAKLELPLDEPQQASLDALKGWKGPHCPIEQAVPPRFKQRPVVVAPPRQTPPPRKAVRAGPPKPPPVQAFQPRPRPQHQGSDEQRELQRAFPSSAWPGQ